MANSRVYSIAISGTTERTKQVAEKLMSDSKQRFSIPWVLTPQPRKIGRKQVLTKNFMHEFAETNNISAVLIDKKIDSEIKVELKKLPIPDFLLVVDFGFLVPSWLLDLPKNHPLNIHPSLLPKWRGSSPGQFVLLNGDKESAVTIMIMNERLDQGPILKQIEFEVDPSWTQTKYYQHSFDLACDELGDVIANLAEEKLGPRNQPKDSPTPTARRLSKKDSFIEWEMLKNAMVGKKQTAKNKKFGPLNLAPTPENIVHACKAFQPWPKLWTIMPTKEGEKRMIVHACKLEKNLLILESVQLAGGIKTPWKLFKKS